jgi:hypothetical protein
MGAVFRPKDLSNTHRKIISNDAIEDLSPDTRGSIIDTKDEINREKDLGIKNRQSNLSGNK